MRRAPDVDQAMTVAGGVRVHSLREIAANKICALLGRGEIRDLVDLRAILARGLDLASILSDAECKDGGVSAATLAWIVDGLRIGPDARLPASPRRNSTRSDSISLRGCARWPCRRSDAAAVARDHRCVNCVTSP